MSSHSLLRTIMLALATAPAFAQTATRVRVTPDPVVAPSGQILGDDEDFDLAVGGSFTNPFAAMASIAPLPHRVFRVTLTGTGTGWQESFLIGVPRVPVAPSAPLLVVFHSYGRVPDEVLYETRYFQKAMARGWYVVAPLGAHKFNFGIDYAQENIRVVLDWVQNHVSIDRERVYGVGFSMGGGGVAGYAARHLDPRELMFAAVTNHTGTVSIRDDYDNANNTSLYEHPLMFGGSPNDEPFAYQRASTIDLDSSTQTIDPNSDLVRNLTHVPMMVFASIGDPLAHLVNQSQRFQDQLVARGGNSLLTLGPASIHAWSTLDENTVLDGFEPLRLTLPTPGTTTQTLADRDARLLHFDITQAAGGQFTPFRWNVQPATNRLYFDQVRNLAQVGFDPTDLELDTTQALTVVFSTTDALPLTMVLRGYNQPPSQVQRNGVPVTSWTYDALAGTVTLVEGSSQGYPSWTLLP